VMNEEDPNAAPPRRRAKPMTKEERLAAALRENLRKRKSQDRGREGDPIANRPGIEDAAPAGEPSRKDT
jgi:hypothetical protein